MTAASDFLALLVMLFSAALIVATAQIAHSANLVTNGSFESPVSPSGGFVTGVPDGWFSIGGGTDIISAGLGGGVGTFPSGLFQTVNMSGGVTYQLSSDYNGGRFQDGTPTSGSVLDYSVDGLVSGSINVDALNVFSDYGPATPWQRLSSDFAVITTGEYTLKFQTPTGAFGSPYLDNVTIDTIVPEPSTLLLGAMATVGLFLRRRR